MKKIFIVLFLVIISITIYINNSNSEEIRLRIIPNSNEPSDILVKEEVKNAVIYYLESIYVDDYHKYVEKINESMAFLESIIEANYVSCSMDFSKHTLYNKEYNGSAIKNKSTLTLVITLGEGNGSNWWGSIYPEYLGISSSDVVRYESLFANLIKYIKGND